jgi:hypothetical protein
VGQRTVGPAAGNRRGSVNAFERTIFFVDVFYKLGLSEYYDRAVIYRVMKTPNARVPAQSISVTVTQTSMPFDSCEASGSLTDP